ncbi:MAG TPA: hypothetical protein PK629_08965 [Oscillospiraceae bacterium]|mgnify:CR=1 FL=1|nr:hypothetical protein [Oscillospiraceae bacterium]HPF55184.1 hypothetical protein [Clostridiales bacterium]HPK36503.1 hypothetical protein [Oscillospiraceae bacterium]HPR75736.1 hypothetical protein [Oscillospiraceae bacterium]
MFLYHVSEEPNIELFEPRLPSRKDLNPDVGLVWALCERTLPNFLTPRDCPRVTYHIGENTAAADIEKYLPKGYSHAVIIETDWLEQLRNATLYLYQFDPTGFYLQDEVAGYYVSEKPQIPIEKTIVIDLEAELKKRKVVFMTVDNLWEISERIKKTTFNWSMCRMAFAKSKPEGKA